MHPAPTLNEPLIARLRQTLRMAKWTVYQVEDLLSPSALEALAREQRVPAMQELQSSDDPAAILTRLFILADPVPTETLADPETLEKLGLIDIADGTATAKIDLRPHAAELPDGSDHHWWIASDQAESQTGLPLDPEHVLGIGSATLSLLRMTIRDNIERALDLGTGCGIQALYLATHAQTVVATDLSERACDFTRFNAALNDAQIDVRQGSLFDPVTNEKFDLIVSNPPFVITPQRIRDRAVMEYRDGGMDRDNLIATVVRQGPHYLKPGGILQMLANWEIQQGQEHWFQRPKEWIAQADVPTQAWLVQRDVVDHARYAEMWLRDSGGQLMGRDQWEQDYRDWVADFQQAQVDEVGMGFLAIRRTTDPTSTIAEAQYLPEGQFPDGQTVRKALDNLTLPDDWQDRHLIRAADVREERHYVPGVSDPEVIRLTQGAGMGRAPVVSSTMAALIGVADGELTIRQVVNALAALTERDADDLTEEIQAELPGILQSGMASFPQA